MRLFLIAVHWIGICGVFSGTWGAPSFTVAFASGKIDFTKESLDSAWEKRHDLLSAYVELGTKRAAIQTSWELKKKRTIN